MTSLPYHSPGLQQPGHAEAEQGDPQDHRDAAHDVGVQRRRTGAPGTAPGVRTLRARAISRPTHDDARRADQRKIFTSNQNGRSSLREESAKRRRSKNACAHLLPARRLGDQPARSAPTTTIVRRGGDERGAPALLRARRLAARPGRDVDRAGAGRGDRRRPPAVSPVEFDRCGRRRPSTIHSVVMASSIARRPSASASASFDAVGERVVLLEQHAPVLAGGASRRAGTGRRRCRPRSRRAVMIDAGRQVDHDGVDLLGVEGRLARGVVVVDERVARRAGSRR